MHRAVNMARKAVPPYMNFAPLENAEKASEGNLGIADRKLRVADRNLGIADRKLRDVDRNLRVGSVLPRLLEGLNVLSTAGFLDMEILLLQIGDDVTFCICN